MCLTPFTDSDLPDKSRWEWSQQLLFFVPDEYNDSYSGNWYAEKQLPGSCETEGFLYAECDWSLEH